jgi:hypothetical protein
MKLCPSSRVPDSAGSALEVSTTAGGSGRLRSAPATPNPVPPAGLTSTTATSGCSAAAAAIAPSPAAAMSAITSIPSVRRSARHAAREIS